MAERFYSRAHLNTLLDPELEVLRQQASEGLPSTLEGVAISGVLAVIAVASTVAVDKLQDMADADFSVTPFAAVLTGVVGVVAVEEGIKAGVKIARVRRIDKIMSRRSAARV